MCYNGNYNGMQSRKMELILKNYPSADYFLKIESMKLESLVIVEQHATVKSFGT